MSFDNKIHELSNDDINVNEDASTLFHLFSKYEIAIKQYSMSIDFVEKEFTKEIQAITFKSPGLQFMNSQGLITFHELQNIVYNQKNFDMPIMLNQELNDLKEKYDQIKNTEPEFFALVHNITNVILFHGDKDSCFKKIAYLTNKDYVIDHLNIYSAKKENNDIKLLNIVF